jgi:hypothetical protein
MNNWSSAPTLGADLPPEPACAAKSEPASCSALLVSGACRHGHAVMASCRGLSLVGPPVAMCLREDFVFDEGEQVVTRKKWVG